MTTFADVARLADNPLTYSETRTFAAILGTSPSKGARSPLLWNAAFVAHGVDAEMLPLDVSEDGLERLLAALEANPRFLGGAVAVPHKEAIARWLDGRVSAEAADVGAVNCLFRGADGRLKGTNTDGEGALRSFENQFGKVAGKRVLLLGLGGAGKAVAAFFRRAVDPGGRLTLCSRTGSAETAAARLSAHWIPWAESRSELARTDVLVNCTSVGSGAQIGSSPVTAEDLAGLPETAQVFDIIYQPSPTALMSLAAGRGLAVLDGTAMNLEQAVLAYGYAAPAPRGATVTRSSMEDAKRKAG